MRHGDLYKMWFSTRGIVDYRSKVGQHYKIGYAESTDGDSWMRKPIDLELSSSGWDS